MTRAILTNVEQREVERRFGLVLDLVVRDIGARFQDDLGDGVRAVDLAGRAGMGFDDRRLASGPASTTDRGFDTSGAPSVSEKNTSSIGASTTALAASETNAPSSLRAVFSAAKAW